MGPASSYISQLASKIDQALLVPWKREGYWGWGRMLGSAECIEALHFFLEALDREGQLKGQLKDKGDVSLGECWEN